MNNYEISLHIKNFLNIKKIFGYITKLEVQKSSLVLELPEFEQSFKCP